VKTTDGREDAELVFLGTGPQVATDWSSDGKWLVVEDNSRDTGRDLWLVPTRWKNQARPIARTRFQEWGGRLSPDDRWMAFVTDESVHPRCTSCRSPEPATRSGSRRGEESRRDGDATAGNCSMCRPRLAASWRLPCSDADVHRRSSRQAVRPATGIHRQAPREIGYDVSA
jgi:hypothetical protein